MIIDSALYIFRNLSHIPIEISVNNLHFLSSIQAQNTVTEFAKIITNLFTGMFDFSNSASGLLQLLSDGMSKSFVSIINSDNKNNNNNPKQSNEGANNTIPTTEEPLE
jgi:hypothetical protein